MVLPSPGHVVPVRVVEPIATRDAVLDAIEPAALGRPLAEVLGPLLGEAAALLAAEVVSVYARERGDDTLLLVGNQGLAAGAVGALRLRVGDGVVGWVAECMRPITAVAAGDDPRFKPVRGLGEEAYPVLLALPIVRRGACLGVLVAQRRAARPFEERDARLASLLAESCGLALAAAGGETRGAALSLPGRGVSPGLGIGRVLVMASATSIAALAERTTWAEVESAIAGVERELSRARLELARAGHAEAGRAIARLELVVSDARFRERAAEVGPEHLLLLAREYARAPFRGGTADPVMVERARDIEELCVLLQLMARGKRARRSGAVWIGQRIGGFFALAMRGAAGVVLAQGGEITTDALAIARAFGVPVVVDVAGLYEWTRPGDLVVVDGDESAVRINPSSTAMVAARGQKRAQTETGER